MTYKIDDDPKYRQELIDWLRSPEGRAWRRDQLTEKELLDLIELDEAVRLGVCHFIWLMIRRALAGTGIWPFTYLWQ